MHKSINLQADIQLKVERGLSSNDDNCSIFYVFLFAVNCFQHLILSVILQLGGTIQDVANIFDTTPEEIQKVLDA